MADGKSIAARFGVSNSPSLREIDDEIAAELTFHLESRTEENLRRGMSPEAARLAAVEQFGDVERIRTTCRNTLAGERIMLQRLQTGLIALLLLAVVVLAFQSYTSQRAHQAALAEVTAQLARLTSANRSTAPVHAADSIPAWVADRPRVVETFPADGATDVDPSTSEIRVTFDKEMADGSWSWVRSSPESFPDANGDVHYLDDLKTCVMPVKLTPATKYVVWFNTTNYQNFKDRDGRPAVPQLLTFTTRP
jgi:hypothetical protein